MNAPKRILIRWLVQAYKSAYRLADQFGTFKSTILRRYEYLVGVHKLIQEQTLPPPPHGIAFAELAAGGRRFRMQLNIPGLIEDTLLREGAWEPHVSRALVNFVRPDTVFVDVGANIGYHTLHLATRFPALRCIAFEPDPVIFKQLARNVALNDLCNVTLRAVALGEVNKPIRFHMQSASCYNRGLSSLAPNADVMKSCTVCDVFCARLDDQISPEDLRSVSVLKIDAQGCEAAVLAGAPQILELSRPVIVLEFESRYHRNAPLALEQLIDLLPGYRALAVSPRLATARYFERPQDMSNLNCDLLFVPREEFSS
jgi:FkbM family methyltransferase